MNDDLIRSQFEYWAAPQGLRLHRRDMAGSTRLGQYCSDNTQLAFEAFRAALSHAAGQEGDDSLPRPLWPVSKEWYRLCERRFAVDRITISGKLAEAIVEAVCAAPPTTSAEVGRDSVFRAVQQGIDSIEVPKLTPARAEYFKAGIRAAIHSINRALAATSGRQAD